MSHRTHPRVPSLALAALLALALPTGCTGDPPTEGSAVGALDVPGDLYADRHLAEGLADVVDASGVAITVQPVEPADVQTRIRTAYQVLGVSRRDFDAPCQSGERSEVIGFRAARLVVPTASPLSAISVADAKALWRGNANGSASAYPAGCVTTIGGQTPQLVRQIDDSDPTDTFRLTFGVQAATLQHRAWCPGVITVSDGPSGPIASKSQANGTTAPFVVVGAGMCALGDTAEQCVIKLGAATGFLAIAPFDGASGKALQIGGIAPSAATVRAATYPLAHRLFMLRSTTHTADSREVSLLAYMSAHPTELAIRLDDASASFVAPTSPALGACTASL